METKNRFAILNTINVQDHIEKKNGLSYLSWAWAWTEFKKIFPDSYYTIYEKNDIPYFTDGRTCWVKTGVTLVDGDYSLEHIENLPIMDYKNASIPLERITSTDMNKTIQRSLTKAIARHGLGCYVYAGEDLPEEPPEVKKQRLEKEAELEKTLKDLKAKIDAAIKVKTKGFDEKQKMDFAKTVIQPCLGTMSYKACQDAMKLTSLLDVIGKMQTNAAPAA